jgi:ammonium transporter Rh
VSFVLSKKEKVEDAGDRFGSTYTSDIFAMVGTLFLWMFWPSFNGALAAGNSEHRVIVNTVLALTNSCVSAFLFSKLLRGGRKLDMVDIQNATLAGGVAIGTSADHIVNPHGALIVGFVAGVLSVVGYVFITPFLEDKIGLHDTCGVHNLHGMPGVLGGVAGAIGAFVATEKNYGAELHNVFAPMGEGKSASEQGVNQVLALLITLAISVGGGLITGLVMKLLPSAEHYGDDGDNWTVFDAEEEECKGDEKASVAAVSV